MKLIPLLMCLVAFTSVAASRRLKKKRHGNKKFMEDCTYSYISEECEVNTHCAKFSDTNFKCLGGNNHPCKSNSECYNYSCGITPISEMKCNSLGVKMMKSAAGWMFQGVEISPWDLVFGYSRKNK